MPFELVDFWVFLPVGGGGREIVRFGAGASFGGISLRVPFGSSPDGSKPHANPILYAFSFWRIQFAAFI